MFKKRHREPNSFFPFTSLRTTTGCLDASLNVPQLSVLKELSIEMSMPLFDFQYKDLKHCCDGCPYVQIHGYETG